MDAITIKNLNKTYKDFSLQDISFSVPKGSVMVLIVKKMKKKLKSKLGLYLREATFMKI